MTMVWGRHNYPHFRDEKREVRVMWLAHGYPPAKWQNRNRNIGQSDSRSQGLSPEDAPASLVGVQVGEMGPELGQEAGARSQAPRVSMREWQAHVWYFPKMILSIVRTFSSVLQRMRERFLPILGPEGEGASCAPVTLERGGSSGYQEPPPKQRWLSPRKAQQSLPSPPQELASQQ